MIGSRALRCLIAVEFTIVGGLVVVCVTTVAEIVTGNLDCDGIDHGFWR